MKKKDYYPLRIMYSQVKDFKKYYRNSVLFFIKNAFEKHGGEFELKVEGADTWEERIEQEDFEPMDELPYYLLKCWNGDNAHEIHFARIKQKHSPSGLEYIEVDGWDWCSEKWVRGISIDDDLESLYAIAEFINSILEEESDFINNNKNGQL